MSDINTMFTRRLLTQVHADVRKHFPEVNLRTAISVTGPSSKQFFVQIAFGDKPKLDEWFRAADRYEARAKAWLRYLERNVPGYEAAAEKAEVA